MSRIGAHLDLADQDLRSPGSGPSNEILLPSPVSLKRAENPSVLFQAY